MELKGRWLRAHAKTLAEECVRLPISVLRDALKAGNLVQGQLTWPGPDGAATASVTFVLAPQSDDLAELRLAYRVGLDDQEEPVEEVIQLQATPQPFGGQRWHFVCPLAQEDGAACNRPARVLYLAPGQRLFGCRACFDLSYLSRQQRRRPAELVEYELVQAGDSPPLPDAMNLAR